jgi:glycosyltransferase involved in cell wall biosynthesis
VSILIPVYGVEKYIEKCAHSVFSQTFERIEYVFVDDCTKDGSVDKLQQVLELYPARKSSTRIIKHEKNRGVAAARQTAIDAATGDYLLFVDSDDYIEKNMVELLYKKAFEKNADIFFVNFFPKI